MTTLTYTHAWPIHDTRRPLPDLIAEANTLLLYVLPRARVIFTEPGGYRIARSITIPAKIRPGTELALVYEAPCRLRAASVHHVPAPPRRAPRLAADGGVPWVRTPA